jgi:hypothetical protein
MINGKTPRYLTLVFAALLAAAMLLIQPYSLRSRSVSAWQAYTQPAQLYLRAALRKDSLALVRQSGSAAPVAWALAAARRHPDSLSVWARGAKAWTGSRHGDTAEVLLYTSTEVCTNHPIWLRFVGSGDQAKVVEAGSRCFEPQ